MLYSNTFKRRELKFLLSEEQYNAVMETIGGYMTADEFGLHTVLNIYLDNDGSDVIRNSLGKPEYKEKLRLRSYGEISDTTSAFLEIKKKFKGIVYKRRLELPYKELFDYVSAGKTPEIADEKRQVFEEVDYFIRRMDLKPKIVISYERQAFFSKSDSEFRLTFDGNIRSRREDLDLRKGADGELLKNQPFRVMELKSVGGVPMWLVKTLSARKIYAASFSKYGNIYLNELVREGGDISCLEAL